MKEPEALRKQDNFREGIKRQLMDHSKEFWYNLNQLKPKDFCDVYLKMLPYGFAKVPDERPLDEAAQQKIILEETTRKATVIGGGLPEDTEDVDYEDE